MIMGHEFAGVVAQSPEGGKYPVGTKVVVYPKLFCGSCRNCKNGRTNICETAPHLGVMDCDGAMTEYIRVRQEYMLPYDPGVPPATAAMAEPFAVAYNAVSKIKDQVSAANHILVVGSGTIGLLVVMVLKLFGAKHVIVSDTFDKRLELASRIGADGLLVVMVLKLFGARHVIVSDTFDKRLELASRIGADGTINPKTADFSDAINVMTGGGKCDFAFEAVGINASAVSSLDALHSSGTAVWIGNAQKMIEINMQAIVTAELTIRGSYAFTISDFSQCVSLLPESRKNLERIITDYYPIADGAEAFKRLTDNNDGSAVKIMLGN